jgi:hypothetical protein
MVDHVSLFSLVSICDKPPAMYSDGLPGNIRTRLNCSFLNGIAAIVACIVSSNPIKKESPDNFIAATGTNLRLRLGKLMKFIVEYSTLIPSLNSG